MRAGVVRAARESLERLADEDARVRQRLPVLRRRHHPILVTRTITSRLRHHILSVPRRRGFRGYISGFRA